MHSNEEGTWVEDDGGDGADGRGGAPHDASRTTGSVAVEALTDIDLLARTRRLVCQSNRVLGALLAHLAEIEARGIHRTRACASIYTYCIYELRMSEDAAYRRVAAARLVKRFPLLLGAIERGELHLTGLLQLGPHLTDANLAEVLARAQFRTKKEIEKLVRLLSPLPDVPSRIEPLGLDRPRQRATWGHLLAGRHPVRELPSDERPDNWLPALNEVASAAFDSVLGYTQARNAGLTRDGALIDSLADAPARIEATGHDVALTDLPAVAPARPDAIDNDVALTELPAELPARLDAINNDVAAIGSRADTPARMDATAESASVASARSHAIGVYVAAIGSGADTPVRMATAESPSVAPARIEERAMHLSGPQRYKVQFTASEEYVALLEEAKSLLAHALPAADLAEIHLRAIQSLVAELKKRKYALSERRVATAAPSPRSTDNNIRSLASAESSDQSPRQSDAAEPREHDAAEPLRGRNATSSRQSAAAEPSRRRNATSSCQRDATELPRQRDAAELPRRRDPTQPSPEHDVTELPRQRDATELPRQRDPTQPSPEHDVTELPRQRDAAELPRRRDATQSSPNRGRHVPAAVRRAVFERDGNRCAYVDERGVRCRETQRLEIHHHEPFARGGRMIAENLSLHCAAHNALVAERDFGREFSLEKRESHAHFTERTLARTTCQSDGPNP